MSVNTDELRRLGSYLKRFYAADGQLRGTGIALHEAADEVDRLRAGPITARRAFATPERISFLQVANI